MAKAYKQEDFEYIMTKVDKVIHRVNDYLYNTGYDKWIRYHVPINRGRMMTLNIIKCIIFSGRGVCTTYLRIFGRCGNTLWIMELQEWSNSITCQDYIGWKV